MRKIKLLHEKLNLHHLKIENLIFFFRLEKRIFSWMSFMHLQWRSPIVVRSTKMPMLRLIVGWTPTQGQLRFSGTKRATRDSYKMGRPSGSKGSRPFTMDVMFAQHPTFFSQLVRDRFKLKFICGRMIFLTEVRMIFYSFVKKYWLSYHCCYESFVNGRLIWNVQLIH